jgi:hypothetical protein
LAPRGKSSMGWFYGFKLHLVINEQGEVLGLTLTPGNTDDRRPVAKLVGPENSTLFLWFLVSRSERPGDFLLSLH